MPSEGSGVRQLPSSPRWRPRLSTHVVAYACGVVAVDQSICDLLACAVEVCGV